VFLATTHKFNAILAHIAVHGSNKMANKTPCVQFYGEFVYTINFSSYAFLIVLIIEKHIDVDFLL